MFDFQAHKNLSNTQETSLDIAIQQAKKLAPKGDFSVVDIKGTISVLPEFLASVRQNAKILFNTRTGYTFA